MWVRVSRFEGRSAEFDEGMRYLEEHVLPAARQMAGWKGVLSLSSGDRSKGLTLTFWESEEALTESEEAAKRLRGQAAEAGGTPSRASSGTRLSSTRHRLRRSRFPARVAERVGPPHGPAGQRSRWRGRPPPGGDITTVPPGYVNADRFDEIYRDSGEIAINNTGKTIAVWGEAFSYTGPGGCWFNRQL